MSSRECDRDVRTLGPIIGIVACAPESTVETASTLSAAGTGIDASKTATGFWERRITYDWTLDKSVTPTSVARWRVRAT